LLVFERKVLRTICGSKIENGVYRRRYNATLRWSHDQKTRRPTTKSSIQSQTQWKEKSRKVGGWPDGVNSDSLALGVRDWTIGRTVLKTGSHGKIFLNRP
jgi:hypothetical protein